MQRFDNERNLRQQVNVPPRGSPIAEGEYYKPGEVLPYTS